MGGGGRGGREGLYARPMYELSSSVWSVVRRERYSLPDRENCLVGVGGPSAAGCSLGSWGSDSRFIYSSWQVGCNGFENAVS